MRNRLFGRRNSPFLNLILGIALVLVAVPQSFAAPTPRIKPAAPGPEFINAIDLERLRVIQSDVKKRNFSRAKAAAPNINDPIARSLAEWMYFYGEDPKISVTEADRFLDTHPEWPAARRIQAHVERRMPKATPADQVLAFFDSRDPVSGHGKLQLARAMFAQGDRDAGELHLRDAWINDGFSVKDEREILANYGGRLRVEDHVARVDRLLWARQVTAARRIFSRLPSDERRKAEARANLLLGASAGGSLYNSLGDEDRADSGVALAAVRYYRRRKEEPRAAAIARQTPGDPATIRNAHRWWSERQLLMRWALTNKIYSEAYAMASGHGLVPGSTDFSEAEFNAGWIALRYLGDAERARTHFAALTAAVKTPISLARGRYWMARASDAMGNDVQATIDYDLAASYPYTYYGQLAAERLGGEALNASFEASPIPSAEDRALFDARPSVAAMKMLTDLGDERLFRVFSYHIDDLLQNTGEYRALAELAGKIDAPHVSVRAGKVSVRKNAFAPEVSYPVIYIPDEAKRFAPEEVILGLSRQESEFNPRAYSRAGARGLMQLIPSTAKITANKERIPYRRSALLDDPIYNMTIGSAHLSHLFERFDGSWLMTFAAYNAGAGRVNQWIGRYGDPRSPNIDPIDWIENIPFAETRNYVQRVMENAQVYRSQLSGDPIPGKIRRDLERGGAQNRAGLIDGINSIGNLIPLQPRIATVADPILNPPPPPAPEVPLEATDTEADTVENTNAQSSEEAAAPQLPARARGTTSRRRARKPVPEETQSDDGPSLAQPELAQQLEQPAQTATDTAADTATDVAESDTLVTTATTASAPQHPIPALSPSTIANDDVVFEDSIAADDECVAYTDFLAQTEGEDASAADLNAGSLAELQTGGGC